MNKIYGIGDEEELAEDLQKELPNRIIAELEKLKAEFEEDKYILLNQITAIKVIDNHIEELKGENNGRYRVGN